MSNPLPWWVHLGVGILFTLGGIFITGFQLFLFVGIIFLIIGVFKIVKKFILDENSSKLRKDFDYSKNKDDSSIKKPPLSIIRCPNCTAQNYTTYNFCHHCGYKLK